MDRARPFDHLILIVGALAIAAPLALGAFIAAGGLPQADISFADWLDQVTRGWPDGPPGAARAALTGALVAISIASIKTLLALLAAYALVFFRIRFAAIAFWAIMLVLLMPLATRMAATLDITHRLGLGEIRAGLVLPLAGSALATLFFREALRALPPTMVDAARLDGVGPMRFLFGVALPLTWPMVAAVFMVSLVDGWNRYLWPILFGTGDELTLPAEFLRNSAIDATASAQQLPPGILAFALAVAVPAIFVVVVFGGRIFDALTRGSRSTGPRHG